MVILSGINENIKKHLEKAMRTEYAMVMSTIEESKHLNFFIISSFGNFQMRDNKYIKELILNWLENFLLPIDYCFVCIYLVFFHFLLFFLFLFVFVIKYTKSKCSFLPNLYFNRLNTSFVCFVLALRENFLFICLSFSIRKGFCLSFSFYSFPLSLSMFCYLNFNYFISALPLYDTR